MANAFFRHVLPVIKGRMHQNDKPLFQANHSLLKDIFNVADINKDIRDVIFIISKGYPQMPQRLESWRASCGCWERSCPVPFQSMMPGRFPV